VSASIELAKGADQNGFAVMLSELLRQNLDDHPEKMRDFDRLLGRVAIVVEDARVSVTLHFESGRLTVHGGIVGIPDLTIRANADDVMQMSLVELVPRLGLPDLRKENARAMIRAQREGRVKMYGALANLPLVVRLTRVMSVN
jgi:hypothetical protein